MHKYNFKILQMTLIPLLVIGLLVNGTKVLKANEPTSSTMQNQDGAQAEATQKISRQLNVVTMTGVNEGDTIHFAQNDGTSATHTSENKFIIKGGKLVDARDKSSDFNFYYPSDFKMEYDGSNKTVKLTILESSNKNRVYLGYVESQYAHGESSHKGMWFTIAEAKKDLENSKTAFHKLKPDQLENIKKQLEGLSDGVKGTRLDGELNSKITINGVDTDVSDKSLLVVIKNQTETKDVIDNITYTNLKSNTKYKFKGQIATIDDEGIKDNTVSDIEEEFTTTNTGNGTHTLTFKNVNLEAGKKYAVNVGAVEAIEKNPHRAEHKSLNDDSLIFLVEQEKAEENDTPSEEVPQTTPNNKENSGESNPPTTSEQPQQPPVTSPETDTQPESSPETKPSLPSENGSTKPQPEASKPQAPEGQPQTPPESSVPAPKPETNTKPGSNETPKQDGPQAPEMNNQVEDSGKEKKEETITSKPSTPSPDTGSNGNTNTPNTNPSTPTPSKPSTPNTVPNTTKQTPTLVSNTQLDIVIDNNQTLVVKTSADLSTFKEVRVDGKVIDKTNYDLKEGSTIVTLKASYLDTLAEGTHKLEIVSNESNTYKAHTVTVLFTIQKPKQTVTHNPNWQQDLRKHTEFISKHNKETNKTLPNTGHINNHSILLASTLLTLVAYKLYKKED